MCSSAEALAAASATDDSGVSGGVVESESNVKSNIHRMSLTSMDSHVRRGRAIERSRRLEAISVAGGDDVAALEDSSIDVKAVEAGAGAIVVDLVTVERKKRKKKKKKKRKSRKKGEKGKARKGVPASLLARTRMNRNSRDNRNIRHAVKQTIYAMVTIIALDAEEEQSPIAALVAKVKAEEKVEKYNTALVTFAAEEQALKAMIPTSVTLTKGGPTKSPMTAGERAGAAYVSRRMSEEEKKTARAVVYGERAPESDEEQPQPQPQTVTELDEVAPPNPVLDAATLPPRATSRPLPPQLLVALRENAKAGGMPVLRLDLSGCELRSVPARVGELTSLTSLDLSHNELAALPPTVCALAQLHTLHLHHNRFTSLPEAIGELVSLREIDLSHNEFVAVETVQQILRARLPRLTSIRLEDNFAVVGAAPLPTQHLQWKKAEEEADAGAEVAEEEEEEEEVQPQRRRRGRRRPADTSSPPPVAAAAAANATATETFAAAVATAATATQSSFFSGGLFSGRAFRPNQ